MNILYYFLSVLLIFVVFFSFREIIKELISGKAKTRVGYRSREKNPLVFWLSIAFTSFAGFIALILLVFILSKII